MNQPVLESDRLRLRPFAPSDAAAVQRLAGDARVAEPTALIPHPYPEGAAESWIATHAPMFKNGTDVICAVTWKDSGELLGAISLTHLSPTHQRTELGYWIGVPYWSLGICTEAAATLIDYAHRVHRITRVVCSCLARNPASARVMEKVGFRYEGRRVKHVQHRGAFEDLLVYGLNLPGR